MTVSIKETSQFSIENLNLTINGNVIDLRGMYQEINIFDSVFTPCMSGSIVIHDAIGLIKNYNFDGYADLDIEIRKDSKSSNELNFKRSFKCYKIDNRENVNQTSEVYVISFISKEFLISKSIKISQAYKTKFSDAVTSILTDYLNVPYSTPNIGSIYNSSDVFKFIIPNLSPLDSIQWITKQTISSQHRIPDFLFFQNPIGYNFMPLHFMLSLDGVCTINAYAKNINENIINELFGAKSVEFLNFTNTIENVSSGIYASKYIGFDTLTKKWEDKQYNYQDIFGGFKLANDNLNLSNNPDLQNKYDSRVVTFPVEYTRKGRNTEHIKKDPDAINYIKNFHEFSLQRKIIFANLKQRRIKFTIAGNFNLFSGRNVNVEMPNFTGSTKDLINNVVSGKYLIVASRHIIQYNRHETVIEVATDSYGSK